MFVKQICLWQPHLSEERAGEASGNRTNTRYKRAVVIRPLVLNRNRFVLFIKDGDTLALFVETEQVFGFLNQVRV